MYGPLIWLVVVLALAPAFTSLPCVAQAPAGAVRPTLLERTGTFGGRVRESSGVAPSRRYPSILWTHNDSGDGPFVYATDLNGDALGAYRIGHATAVDWEDIALGPCPSAEAAAPSCLYISDLGDNAERRRGGTIYIVPEPPPPNDAGDTSRVIDAIHSIRVRYADGSHDTEAILVSPGGDVSVVTKGWSGTVVRFFIPHDSVGQNAITLAPYDTLPIKPTRSLGRLVTGAAVAPSGRRAVVRTYTELFFFRLDGSRLTPDGPPCWLGPTEPQGEGVGFLDEDELVLTSEALLGEPGTIYRVRCPSGGQDQDRKGH